MSIESECTHKYYKMRKLLLIVFSLITLISVAQLPDRIRYIELSPQPDTSWYTVLSGDTIFLRMSVRPKLKPPAPTGKIIRLPVANNGIYVTNVTATLNPQPGDVL